jgi:hypothetical protein
MVTLAGSIVGHENRHWMLARLALAPIRAKDSLEAIVILPGAQNTVAANTWLRVRRQYIDSSTSSVTRTHAVGDNYPRCDMRP